MTVYERWFTIGVCERDEGWLRSRELAPEAPPDHAVLSARLARSPRCPTTNTPAVRLAATVFRVTPDQLALRGGQVRCGQCKTVFDGVAQQVALSASDRRRLRRRTRGRPAPARRERRPTPDPLPEMSVELSPCRAGSSSAELAPRPRPTASRPRPRRRDARASALYLVTIVMLVVLGRGAGDVSLPGFDRHVLAVARPTFERFCEAVGARFDRCATRR
jgi:predicted Zn finger-like uncharacterized protein